MFKKLFAAIINLRKNIQSLADTFGEANDLVRFKFGLEPKAPPELEHKPAAPKVSKKEKVQK